MVIIFCISLPLTFSDRILFEHLRMYVTMDEVNAKIQQCLLISFNRVKTGRFVVVLFAGKFLPQSFSGEDV